MLTSSRQLRVGRSPSVSWRMRSRPASPEIQEDQVLQVGLIVLDLIESAPNARRLRQQDLRRLRRDVQATEQTALRRRLAPGRDLHHVCGGLATPRRAGEQQRP